MARRRVSVLVAAICVALAAPVASASAAPVPTPGPVQAPPKLIVSGQDALIGLDGYSQGADSLAADSQGSNDQGDLGARLRAGLRKVTAAGAAASFGEVVDEDGVRRAGSGVSDLRTGAPVRPDGRYRVGSITKVFTSTTVLQLVGEHRIGLDDPVESYLPGLVPNGAHITIRQLLNHSSGVWDPTNEPDGGVFPTFTNVADARKWIEGGGFKDSVPRDKVVAAATAHAPYFAPGTSFHYSNTNFILLGMVIEKVTGNAYTREIEARILRPLGLTRTYFPGASTDIRGPHAHGYVTLVDGTGPTAPRTDYDISEQSVTWATSAGELISTTDDLIRFEKALLAGRLLKQEQMAAMRTTIPMTPDGSPSTANYGLGLARVDLSCGPVYGHDGSMPGYLSQMWSSGNRWLAVSTTPKGDPQQVYAQMGAQFGLLEDVFCGKGGEGKGGGAKG
ncbi:serine hydrolase domain-containing protein [Streptomyces sp. NRRL WC-3742]|uniref:serine hydrolase domain-containing protein n=1 Tax=Streptomyces sp. NRRL WC-3742 TaxID=1463934 RepID=UPI000A429853|nr:serine hydrolase domain-containing protein [Streptomyces sp. NRRL WC-3742]